ncbi:hypothetical protein JW766_01150 [Candidatus Dojkabacteria bacterium]|nr:hypothetical protein [Candidatus Dojkabacteria bacterium]
MIEKIHSITEYLNRQPLLYVGLILLVASFLLFIPNDPDFPWHLKYGELTLEQGPISHDPYSHTFADYTFYDYQWFTHVLMYTFYKLGGFTLVAILYGVIVLAALLFSVNTPIKKVVTNKSKIILLLVGLLAVKPIIGIRPQMASVLGIAIVYFLTIKYLRTKSKTVFLIPLVILIWANLHPGFLSGIMVLLIIIFSEILKVILRKLGVSQKQDPFYEKKPPSFKILILVLILSSCATLCTPFFYNIVKQSVLFSLDAYAQEHIVEWLGVNFQELTGKFIVIYMLITVASIFRRKFMNLTEVLIVAVFGFMALQSVRHIPLFVIVSIPSILASPDWKFLNRLDKFKSTFWLFTKSSFLTAGLLVFLFTTFQFFIINSDRKAIYGEVKYPYEAVQFLKEKNYEGNIFNNYGWGGFLIWEYPEKKTFVDGRMTSWRIDHVSILEEYVDLSDLLTPDWQEKLQQYEVRIILSDTSTPLCNVLRNSSDWELVYEDDLSVVLYKKEPYE